MKNGREPRGPRLHRRQLAALLLLPHVLACRPRATKGTVAGGPDASPPTTREGVDIDVSQTTGAFARLSGVQGSPYPVVAGDVDRTAQFREFRIEHVRVDQDCPPNTLTLGGIFPDDDADPDRSESYHFAEIDRHLSAARAAGSTVLWQSSYDVGRTDRWKGINLGGRPPKNLDRWARVIEHCLEHFNNGWASGFDASVKNVEFLNEPNGLGGFSGADAHLLLPTFLRFLSVIEGYNGRHPNTAVRAVGPGIPLCFDDWPVWGPIFAEGLARIRAERRTLPVFSFHTYGTDVSPSANARLARAIRDLLDQHGMASTELWNTEWQAGDFLDTLLHVDRAAKLAATTPQRRLYQAGMATYALACKSRWQGVVQGSYYYRATQRAFADGRLPGSAPSDGGHATFFSRTGKVGAMALQERLTDLASVSMPQRCPTRLRDNGLMTALGLRSADSLAVGVLLTNLTTRPIEFAVRMAGVARERVAAARTWALDGTYEGLVEQQHPAPAVAAGRLEMSVPVGALASSLLSIQLLA